MIKLISIVSKSMEESRTEEGGTKNFLFQGGTKNVVLLPFQQNSGLPLNFSLLMPEPLSKSYHGVVYY